MESLSRIEAMHWLLAGHAGGCPLDGRGGASRGIERLVRGREGDWKMQTELRERLVALARTPLLLVACDYDGTLARLVENPSRAVACPEAIAAFHAAAGLPWTFGAVVSGRAFEDLRAFLGGKEPEFVVGSHGAEWQSPGVALTTQERDRLLRVAGIVARVAKGTEGARCELKPAGVVLHVRGVSATEAGRVVREAMALCATEAGVRVRCGNEIVEFMVVDANKGDAVERARRETGATAVLFIGDDLTDEDVFGRLLPDDVSIKVGGGETCAGYRVSDVDGVASVLELIASVRGDWVRSRGLVSLSECAVLSDQRTLAVVSPGAAISWLCLPRIDSAAVFASLIGGPGAGVFEIGPVNGGAPEATKYEGDSFVLSTRWEGLRVTDYLDCSAGRAYQKAGRVDLIRVIEGAVPARVRFAPRLDYGRLPTQLRLREDGIEVEGSNDPIVLRSRGVEWRIESEGPHQTAEAIVDASRGPVVLELRYGTANLRGSVEEEAERREQNRKFWSGWAGTLKLPSGHKELVKRSALVLKALCYGPSGAISAAATMSLPEQVGGERNWDYRFCWPRDAAKAAAALVRLGNTGHALKLLDWILDIVDRSESPDRLHPIYSVSGGELPSEAELGHLAGYGQSKPVRVSNAAANQVQLDVFGPIVNLVAMLAERGAPISPEHWRLVRAMVRAVEARWVEPDHGIWEMRLERRHHVHSKVMCWHTVDRALVVEDAVCGTLKSDWKVLREAIGRDVCEHGWSRKLGAFAGAYGHDYADAAVLEIGLTGLLGRDDARWGATVDAVMRALREGPTVRRYREADGLTGTEGGMHICTGWLIESLVSLGRIEEARELFEGFAALIGGVGVMTEQFDTKSGAAVGNLAQAYSHLAFIDAAVAIERAERGNG